MVHILMLFALFCVAYDVLAEEPRCSTRYTEERLLEKTAEINCKLEETLERLDRMENKTCNPSAYEPSAHVPTKSLSLQDLEIDGWQLFFRATSGNGQPVYEAWTKGQGTSVEKPLSMERSYATHYRHKNLSNWSNLGIKYVKFALYDHDKEVAFVIFNGVGSDMNNWFSKTRVVSSSYTDLTTADEYNYFSIEGHVVSAIHDRRFFISRNYASCPNDRAHILVVNSKVASPICNFDRQPSYPQFIYSRTNSVDFFDRGTYGMADYLVVLVKTA